MSGPRRLTKSHSHLPAGRRQSRSCPGDGDGDDSEHLPARHCSDALTTPLHRDATTFPCPSRRWGNRPRVSTCRGHTATCGRDSNPGTPGSRWHSRTPLLSKSKQEGHPEAQLCPALTASKARAHYLDLDDRRQPGPQKVRALRKLLPDQEAAQAGLELDDKADVGLPELLAVVGSGDLGDS